MPEAISACSICVGVSRFDWFDSQLVSIGTRCTCHRAPPCFRRAHPVAEGACTRLNASPNA
eukprot:15454477-Alexandrium_andersonii.AAC.1